MEGERPYVSPRALEEANRKYRVRTFDRMVDLALDGVITLDQAILGYQEEIAADEAIQETENA